MKAEAALKKRPARERKVHVRDELALGLGARPDSLLLVNSR
jgi:hypothetical protein